MARRVEIERARRIGRTSLLDGLYPEQLAAVSDPAKRKSICTPRQVGKSWTLARYLADRASKSPKDNTLHGYLTDTRQHAKDLLWEPLLDILDTHNIKYKPHWVELGLELEGAGKIRLFGADDERQTKKLRGYQFRTFVVDEAQNIRDRVLRRLVLEDVNATLSAYDGPLVLSGTPGQVAKGLFYEATEEPGKHAWSTHSWTHLENPQFPRWANDPNWRERVKEFLAEKAKEYGGPDSPAYQREWLRRWVQDVDAFMVHLAESINALRSLQPDLRNVLGLDIGWDDDTAWVVTGYSQHTGLCQVPYEYSEGRLTVDAIMAKTIEVIERFSPEVIVADTAGGSKIVVETVAQELRKRYAIPIIAAEKQKKAAFVNILNSECRVGRMQLNPGGALWNQAVGLVWNSARTLEADGQDCDLFDAWLYSWRRCHNYIRKEPERPAPKQGSPEYWAKVEDKYFDDALARCQAQQDMQDSLIEGILL